MMKKILPLVILLSIVSLVSCKNQTTHQRLSRNDWESGVKENINSLLSTYGVDSSNYKKDTYVIFDFDNTSSIFDVQEQALYHQIETMSFEIAPDNLSDILFTGLGDHDVDRSEYGYGKGSYSDWVSDITKAYTSLYSTYGPFTHEGVDESTQNLLKNDNDWKEFEAKLSTLYSLVGAAEGTNVSYPWVLYLFTGMSEANVYDFAYRSHSKYKNIDTTVVTITSPKIESKVGVVTNKITCGIQVTENIKELWSALANNGIDVWVCSASHSSTISAAIDVFGLHKYVKGIIGMTLTVKNGKIINQYDYQEGYAWMTDGDSWKRGTLPTKIQTHGEGKVIAISNAIAPLYNNHGPIAGFMDSTGDYNFCTEYQSLKLVVCFNRANRAVTDGGGLIAEVAMYQKNTLHYDLKSANANNDILYLLQGRDENGKRTFRNSNASVLYNTNEEKLFKNAENYAELDYFINNSMSIKDILNSFCIKTNTPNELGFKYGFLDSYSGYRSHV